MSVTKETYATLVAVLARRGITLSDIGTVCRVVRPEHLVVYKLIAGRPRDVADAEEVARTRHLAGEPLDTTLIRRWAAEWGVVDRLEQLLAALAADPD